MKTKLAKFVYYSLRGVAWIIPIFIGLIIVVSFIAEPLKMALSSGLAIGCIVLVHVLTNLYSKAEDIIEEEKQNLIKNKEQNRKE